MSEYLTDLERYDQSRVRNTQVALGPSDIGRCLRQAAFQQHGVPPSDDRSRGLARLGTLTHLGWSAMVEALGDPDRRADVLVVLPGLRAQGHADDVDWGSRTVNDLKTTSARSWERWVTYGLKDSIWDQVELYAYGLHWRDVATLAPWHDLSTWTLRVTALNRETGQEAVFERPADYARGELLAERLVTRQDILDASTSPDDVQREGSGPNTGFPCDYCDWVTACWGEADGDLSAQAQTIVDDPDAVAAVALEYLDAAEQARVHKKRQDDARAFLQGIPAADYGAARLKWQGGNPLAPKVDEAAAVALLEQHGLPVPRREAFSAKSLRVTRVPPATLAASSGSAVSQPAPILAGRRETPATPPGSTGVSPRSEDT